MVEGLEIGGSFSHYRIVSKIGEGGMGEVYLADDTQLGRQVALKVLPADVARDEEHVRRFVQEAKASSALNHPNILTVHEIGKFKDSRYIATELIKGETLRTRLAGEPLTLGEVLDIGQQVAAALVAAHAAGIVHRDIKPENIMVRDDGLVKVLDFGLAKLTEQGTEPIDSEGETRSPINTSAGIVLGTVAYMSPEQARGKVVDVRSDVWSLGVVIYEMLANSRPFVGETPTDVMAAILIKDPAPVDENTPHEMQRIIRKSLQKKADERYQTSKDILLDLKNLKRELEFSEELERSHFRLSTGSSNVGTSQFSENVTIMQSATTATQATDATQSGVTRHLSSAEYVVNEIKSHKLAVAASLLILAVTVGFLGYLYSSYGSTKPIKSIAVLPFVNENDNGDMEYLADGISEGLINTLSQLNGIKVIARSSSFKFKGRSVEPKDAARELLVDAVITGRIVKRGDDFQISVDLIDARDNTQVWGERYTRRISDLVVTQDAISLEISERLKAKLSVAGQTQLARHSDIKPEAYELLLRGRFAFRKLTPESMQKAVEYYEEALRIQPDYALAYAEIATVYRILGVFSVNDPTKMALKAEAATLKALELDDDLAEAHSSMAGIKRDKWDWAGAEVEYQKALFLNPNFFEAREGYAIYLSILGQHEKALLEMKHARDLDPLRLLTNLSLGAVYYNARRYDEAIEVFKAVLKDDREAPAAYAWLAIAYAAKGSYREAIEAYREAERFGDNTPSTQGFYGFALAKAGERDAAVKILERLKESKEFVPPLPLAILYLGLGDHESALKTLEDGLAARDSGLQYLKVEPHLDSIAQDPRFQNVVKLVGLP